MLAVDVFAGDLVSLDARRRMAGVQLERFRSHSIEFGVADDLAAFGIDVAVVGAVAVVVEFAVVVADADND